MTIDELINKVLIENNKVWLNKEQAEHSISEGRLSITRRDVYDIIQQLPIHINKGISNTKVSIEQGVIVVKPNDENEK